MYGRERRLYEGMGGGGGCMKVWVGRRVYEGMERERRVYEGMGVRKSQLINISSLILLLEGLIRLQCY